MQIRNRRAKFDYEIESTLEVGLVLQGSEVKALREGKASIGESFAAMEKGEAWLMNAYIGPYEAAVLQYSHEHRRKRKLLLKAREIRRLIGQTQKTGLALVPMDLYFNGRGIAKLKLGLGKAKRKIDKRETIKDRDWKRQKQSLLRN